MANSLNPQDTEPRKIHWYTIGKWKTNEWIVVVPGILILSAIACFVWEDKSIFDFKFPINYEKFGTFGDFIGGVVGTVFAYLNVRLLIKTIDLQNKANAQSEKSFENIQKTENVKAVDTQLNSLLSLYQSIVDSMSFDGENGKKAMTKISSKVLEGSQGFFGNDGDDEKAMLAFETEYANQRDKLAVYFRIVYRILCVLQQANIDDKIRYNYAKMVRAQLTESELCLMRYNALTYNGRNTQDKILIFNLLKHLPMSRLYDLQPFYTSVS